MTWVRFHVLLLLVYFLAVLYVADRLRYHDRPFASALVAIADAAVLSPEATEYALDRLHEELREMRGEIKEVRQEHATLLRWVMTTLGAIVAQLVVYVGKHMLGTKGRR